MKPIVREHIVSTDEIVEREMTDKEFKSWDSERKEKEEALNLIKEQEKIREAARQSALEKLAALGLTEAEIQALAG